MKDLFTIQTESGQLWLDIKAHLDAKDGDIAALITDRDRLAALLATASAAFDAGDVAALRKLREDAQKTEKEKALEAALAEKAEVEARIAALSNQ